MALEIQHVYLRNERVGRVQMGLVMSFSAFTGSRLDALPADGNSSCKDSRESSADDLSTSTLAYDSDGDTLVDGKPDLKAWSIRLGTICYGDIDLFLLRNPDNPDRDILMAEVDF